MRRTFCFAFASALTVGGLYLLYFQFIKSASVWAFGRALPIGICFTGYGFYWLWSDFISPIFRPGVR